MKKVSNSSLKNIFFIILFIPMVTLNSFGTSDEFHVETEEIEKGDFVGHAIYENNIVYTLKEKNIKEIYLYNINTKKTIRISDGGSPEMPAIHGEHIVWEDDEDTSLVLYNLGTDKKDVIVKGHSAIIYGNIIVYNYGGAKVYHINNGLIENNSDIAPGDIYKNRVVFSESPYIDLWDLQSDVVMYDLETKKKTFITDEDGREHGAVIFGDNICYKKDAGDNGLFLYNISTKDTIQIAPQGSDLDIYRNDVVFTRSDAGYDYEDSGISLYEIDTGKTYKVTTIKGRESHNEAKIYKNHIIWEVSEGGKDIDILVLGTISFQPTIFGLNQITFFVVVIMIFGFLLFLLLLHRREKKKRQKQHSEQKCTYDLNQQEYEYRDPYYDYYQRRRPPPEY